MVGAVRRQIEGGDILACTWAASIAFCWQSSVKAASPSPWQPSAGRL